MILKANGAYELEVVHVERSGRTRNETGIAKLLDARLALSMHHEIADLFQ
ncbi:hypothetical protein GGQ72_004176 [Rhizobium rhizoryzae]|uniref:Uncharacterized protein n=1 Tax=Rhizobium rhizoryzae TaxID=451876 RepID=A0A7W6LJX9_9HYPH|nr:hypothetical protein [Rhizobium rhizoryzae]